MRVRLIILIIWTMLQIAGAFALIDVAMQPKVAAGNQYGMPLTTGSYVTTKGSGTAVLQSCDFFSFETADGLEYGMYVQQPADCRIKDQLAVATVSLRESDKIQLNSPGSVWVTLIAQDGGVIWSQAYLSLAELVFISIISSVFMSLVWLLGALVISFS